MALAGSRLDPCPVGVGPNSNATPRGWEVRPDPAHPDEGPTNARRKGHWWARTTTRGHGAAAAAGGGGADPQCVRQLQYRAGR
ncbi:hypothetical protein NL676_020079 [Syzygium grande]|nr:hypothetical protein NL676_020079 [Syzygium grande]